MPEERIAAGNSIGGALTAFRERVNQPGTIFSTDHWLLPKLDQLRQLLTNPITQEEAEALLDVLYQRHWMADLIAWLESRRPVNWADFFIYRENLAKEELRKRADERDRRRAAGLDPDFNFKLFPDEYFPKISDICPDCGSSHWKPIAYGLPTEDTEEDARRGHVVLGGCMLGDAKRYCVACFNSWPTKPDVSKPAGRPEWIQQQIADSRVEYAHLSALADSPPAPEEPVVERAWARIDRSVRFLVSFGDNKTIVTKNLGYFRLGGAPTYNPGFLSWCTYDESRRLSTLAAVVAIRFERTHQPERHNLYNDWGKVQAHQREFDRDSNEESFCREWVQKRRKKLIELLKLARAIPERLPSVISTRSFDRDKKFLVRFPWGIVGVERQRFSLLEPLEYRCTSSCTRDEDPELAQNLACAAAMLAEFPRLEDADRHLLRAKEAE